MTKIFLGGSRSLSRLNLDLRQRLDNVIHEGFHVIVGDANGADKALQAYLAQKGYENVSVFCSGVICRNNLGNWRTTFVPTGRSKLDFAHYAEKDTRMATEADYGLFLWDGKSRGTLNSIKMLIGRGRPVLVYISSKRKFVTLRTRTDLERLLQEHELVRSKALGSGLRRRPKSASQSPFFVQGS